MIQYKLANNLKVYRARFDLTQEDLALGVGVTRKTINRVEKGAFIPSTLLSLKIAKFFNEKLENVFYLKKS